MPSAISVQRLSDLTGHSHSGNLARFRSCLRGIIQEAWTNSGTDSILIFGYPGNGKTSLIDSVGADLSSKFPGAEAVTVRCHSLVPRLTAVAVLDRLHEVEQIVQSEPDRPRVIIFDEFDAISIDRAATTGDRSVCFWCMRFLEDLTDYENTVVLLITNKPEIIDEAVSRKVEKILYLPFPDDDAVAPILASKIRMENVSEVVAEIAKLCTHHRIRAAIRGLVRGLRLAQSRGYIEDGLLRASLSDVAEAIVANPAFVPHARLLRYEDMYSEYMVGSDFLLKCYAT